MTGPPPDPSAPGTPAPWVPWFSVTMTVRNNLTTIEDSLGSILPQLAGGGELVIVDAESTDGTWAYLESLARSHPEMTVVSRKCNRGVGRNLAVTISRAPIVLTQVDGDNRYATGVLVRLSHHLREHPQVGLAFAVGEGDVDPSSTRFYAWRRASFEGAGGYKDTQEREDPPLLLRAFQAGFPIERCLLPRVADDLKPRLAGRAPTVPPWGRATHNVWAARKFRVMGYRYSEYVRLLWLTRRTPARTAAGTVLGLIAYIQGALHRDGNEVLERDDARQSPPPPPSVPTSGNRP
jgi:glycosyltransferase involved in cell wall biosynthesis